MWIRVYAADDGSFQINGDMCGDESKRKFEESIVGSHSADATLKTNEKFAF